MTATPGSRSVQGRAIPGWIVSVTLHLLLLVAFMVLSVVITLVLGLPFALAGEQAALLGEGVLSGLVNAVMVVVAVCVLAAVHTQLARLGHERTPSADG